MSVSEPDIGTNQPTQEVDEESFRKSRPVRVRQAILCVICSGIILRDNGNGNDNLIPQ